jgi:hypothetical protein
MLSSYYRIAGFVAVLAMLLGAGYYAGLFGPETASNRAPQGAPAMEEEQAPDQDVALRTAYLDLPIGKAHRIFLKWQPDGNGELWLDEAQCTLNRLGEEKPAQPTVGSTTVKFSDVPGKLEGGSGTNPLLDVQGIGDTYFRIVKPRSSCPCYRLLVLDKDQKVIRVVTLERWRIAPKALRSKARAT